MRYSPRSYSRPLYAFIALLSVVHNIAGSDPQVSNNHTVPNAPQNTTSEAFSLYDESQVNRSSFFFFSPDRSYAITEETEFRDNVSWVNLIVYPLKSSHTTGSYPPYPLPNATDKTIIGGMVFSPNGLNVAVSHSDEDSTSGYITIFDFDKGVLSNPMRYALPLGTNMPGNVIYSPNGRLLVIRNTPPSGNVTVFNVDSDGSLYFGCLMSSQTSHAQCFHPSEVFGGFTSTSTFEEPFQ